MTTLLVVFTVKALLYQAYPNDSACREAETKQLAQAHAAMCIRASCAAAVEQLTQPGWVLECMDVDHLPKIPDETPKADPKGPGVM